MRHHESDLPIEEHYTDTAGFTDPVFALMHMPGFRFARQTRDLGDTKLYIPGTVPEFLVLKPMIGGTLNVKQVRAHWDDFPRLVSSIKHGTVAASPMLRELGRLERTPLIPNWRQNVELRQSVHAGWNKGGDSQRLRQRGLHPPPR